ncbi:cation:proton antiporter [Prevotella sp.]|uniref:cation:proton antiporter n=1 Tax=Prevotella sp. TaxID=59823 RepID=UPI003DA5C30E
MQNISQYLPITDPTWIFFIVLCIILFAPILMGKLRIPHLIGMILAGVIVGPHGFNILSHDSSFELFGKVGLYYIMFLAGLEMNMADFKKNRIKTSTHGILAFAIPMIIGFALNTSLLKYGVLTSVLLASMYASHTLIAYPIVLRYGLSQQRSVTIAAGATAITDTLTLLVLAIVGGMFKGEVNGLFWFILAIKLCIVFFIIIYFFPRMARYFFQRYEENVTQFIFVLAMTFLGAGMMAFIGMEGLLGAFLTGLVLNRYVPNISPLMTHLEFVGNALFIPYFLIGVGMLININIIFAGFGTLKVAGVMIAVALSSKWLASLATQKLFNMKSIERELIYGLSNAQAGATLAAVLVGYNIILPNGQRLLNDDVLNGTIILILVTCIFSSFTTERAARKIALTNKNKISEDKTADDEKILIPVEQKETANELVKIGIMMRNTKLNRGIIGLNVVLDDLNLAYNQEKGRNTLEYMEMTANAANVRMIVQSRIATNISNGISHAFKEYSASEIIMGMHECHGNYKNFWGNITQNLFSDISRQLMIVRCLQPINTFRRIQVAVPKKAEFEPGFYRWLERLSRMAANLNCRIQFHGNRGTLSLINEYVQNRHTDVRAEYVAFEDWDELPKLAINVNDDHLFVVITARKGTISYIPSFDSLPEQLTRFFNSNSLMIIFPDQYGDTSGMTFTKLQLSEEHSPYQFFRQWMIKNKNKN